MIHGEKYVRVTQILLLHLKKYLRPSLSLSPSSFEMSPDARIEIAAYHIQIRSRGYVNMKNKTGTSAQIFQLHRGCDTKCARGSYNSRNRGKIRATIICTNARSTVGKQTRFTSKVYITLFMNVKRIEFRNRFSPRYS